MSYVFKCVIGIALDLSYAILLQRSHSSHPSRALYWEIFYPASSSIGGSESHCNCTIIPHGGLQQPVTVSGPVLELFIPF